MALVNSCQFILLERFQSRQPAIYMMMMMMMMMILVLLLIMMMMMFCQLVSVSSFFFLSFFQLVRVKMGFFSLYIYRLYTDHERTCANRNYAHSGSLSSFSSTGKS